MIWRILLSAAIAWLIAQFLKFIIDGIKTGKFNLKMLVYPGKMPSGHTATVVAMTMAILFVEGFSSLFAVALIFSIIIMYDTVTVRRQVGIITKTLNSSVKKKIRYFEGHTPSQVLAGAGIGIITAVLIAFI